MAAAPYPDRRRFVSGKQKTRFAWQACGFGVSVRRIDLFLVPGPESLFETKPVVIGSLLDTVKCTVKNTVSFSCVPGKIPFTEDFCRKHGLV
jgi:hypothetical protein